MAEHTVNHQKANNATTLTLEEFAKRYVEIRNEGDRSFWVSVCRSKITGILYVHIGTEREQLHGNIKKVLPMDYEQVEVNNEAL